MYIGSDAVEITIANDIEGSFTFQAKAKENASLDPGGYRTEDDQSGVTGSGRMIGSMSRVRWKMGPVVSAVDLNVDLDHEAAARIAGAITESTFTFAFLNGAIFRGKGRIVGDISVDTLKATQPLTFSGGGKLEKIA